MENQAYDCSKESEIAVIKSQLKNIYKQLDRYGKSYEQVQEMISEIKVIGSSLVTVCDELKTVQDNVDAIKYKSLKRADKIAGYFFSAVVTGLVVYIFAQIGLR